ncbi:MAG TPA: DmsC/YnfH family molybdoenzyme membrane anchor subunit [Polyangia bacterium]|nr:DmsC/YnfH family molybdoenzyme membrane anchor subunit [Polyangia bacterium]
MPPSSSPTAVRSTLLRIAPPADVASSVPSKLTAFLDRVLHEQQQLTAVDRFSRHHDDGQAPAQGRYYRDLIPFHRPGPGQQYSFEVDLDVCTGCKACVASCHALNGLDEGEVWRTVGLLHGGTADAPAQQTVTTSCHHCVDPACMRGCPVKAYEKDPVTGIVHHLDDQCIGCQYCTLMCPYDAPKYSASRGIVRKCDMCSDRLAVGEAPACVQACPNQAIRIRISDQTQAVQASEAGVFLPGAPAPDHTLPTTVYKTARPVARNLLPADFYSVSPEHGHLPLAVMLVLTQLAVGTFITNVVKERVLHQGPAMGAVQAVVALALALMAIGAATLHLGRPQFAFRAVLGFATSWMSREIVAFGLFATTAALYAASLVPARIPLPGLALLARWRSVWELAAVAAGAGGVACSVMIYAATRRAQWGGPATAFKFLVSGVILGVAAALVTDAALGVSAPGAVVLLKIVIVGSALKLAFEASVFRHLWSRPHTTWKRVALLMVGALRGPTVVRFAVGGLGGIVLPALLLGAGAAPSVAGAAAVALLLFIGELIERSLFFRSAPPSRMPGAQG